jgi:hypothetical protein
MARALTRAERAAGRAWRQECRDRLDRLNAEDPPGLLLLALQHHVRHECPAVAGRSVSMELKERYEAHPELPVAWIWKEGRCRCGLLGRSRDGYVVDSRDRPPLRRTHG